MPFMRRSTSPDSQDLPKGIELRPFYDQSELVNDSIKSVRDAILIGLVLASLIMVLFLRDWGHRGGRARDPRHGGGNLHRPASHRREFQLDDPGRPGRGGGLVIDDASWWSKTS